MPVCNVEGRLRRLPPELSVYQDATKCAVVKKVWYLTYASFKLLELPSNATCLRFSLVAPIQKEKGLSLLEYDPNGMV
ncbi:hypothetical protein HPB52_007003 [Rhipicephalus sanguineus]|uniref:Uncharacterized protein n=1 Tax=Rhipicephalus sanguineus TaxID=34632 RepID=A0A9D4PUS4_RHISA|nr:hypothetical protein HPB52_007003 [Rhipicephalus sanguineus]